MKHTKTFWGKKHGADVPVLVAVVGASGRYGAELLAIATESLRGELVLRKQRAAHKFISKRFQSEAEKLVRLFKFLTFCMQFFICWRSGAKNCKEKQFASNPIHAALLILKQSTEKTVQMQSTICMYISYWNKAFLNQPQIYIFPNSVMFCCFSSHHLKTLTPKRQILMALTPYIHFYNSFDVRIVLKQCLVFPHTEIYKRTHLSTSRIKTATKKTSITLWRTSTN